MPRGLGDDPLSKQRKKGKGRPVASNTSFMSSMTASSDAPPMQSLIREEPISGASASSQQSPSYNDVFFQRRSENDLDDAPAMNNDTPSPSVAEPAVQPTEEAEIGRVSVVTAPAQSPQPQGGKDAVPGNILPTLGEIPIVPKEDTKPAQPKTEERGFFKRIFGRLGQQRSHTA